MRRPLFELKEILWIFFFQYFYITHDLVDVFSHNAFRHSGIAGKDSSDNAFMLFVEELHLLSSIADVEDAGPGIVQIRFLDDFPNMRLSAAFIE